MPGLKRRRCGVVAASRIAGRAVATAAREEQLEATGAMTGTAEGPDHGRL